MFESVLEDRARLRAVESELLTLAGNLAAATCRYLQLLAEFDTACGWSGPGLKSCAHWLSWKAGENLRTAREHLRVAHALPALPRITAAFAAGRISYAKVRAITRIATPETEDGLLSLALHGTASHVEAAVAAARAQEDQRPVAAKRAMQWSGQEDGSLRVVLRLPAEQGAQVVAAVDAAVAADAEPTGQEPGGSAEPPDRPLAARRLDALMSLITGERLLPDTTLIVHLRADLDLDHDPDHELVDDPESPADTALADTAQADTAPDGSAEPSSGTPPPTRPPDPRVAWIDGGPSIHPTVAQRLTCAATRHLQAHHVRWWRHGGRTDIDNLALVCSFHHHLIHDSGYQLRPDGHGGFAATQPDGTPIPTAGEPTSGHAETLRLPGIDARSTTPAWGGERLDRDQLLAWLLPTLHTTPAAA